MSRTLVRSALLSVPWLLVASLFAVDHRSVGASPVCWPPPVHGVITDPFRAPACPYCRGNRGLEYRTGSPEPVHAVAAGEVSFAGSVAGTRYVVVRLANGWRLTYGRLAEVSVTTGSSVLTGTRVGVTQGELFFGLRIGEEYHDPAPLLGQFQGVRRLIPDDGRAPRPAPAPRLTCTNVASGMSPPTSRVRDVSGARYR